MHENSLFLSYRNRPIMLKIMCTYAHDVTLGSRCKMASSHRVTDLEKIPVESPRMKLRRHCQYLGLYLFRSCYFLLLEPCQVRGVSVFYALFSLAFTTGWTSSERLPFIGCFILFSQFIHVCFIIQTYVKMKKFCSYQFNRCDFVASLGQGLGLGQLPVLAIHCFFSWLALLFLELYRSFTVYE